VLAAIVVSGVILAVFYQALGEFPFEAGDAFALRIPIDIQRFDLGAEKVIGAARAKFREARGVVRVYESQDFFVILDGADETFVCETLSAQPRENRGECDVPLLLVEGLVLSPSEYLGVASFRFVLILDI